MASSPKPPSFPGWLPGIAAPSRRDLGAMENMTYTVVSGLDAFYGGTSVSGTVEVIRSGTKAAAISTAGTLSDTLVARTPSSALVESLDNLRASVEALRIQIAAFQEQMATSSPEPRKISDEDAKKEVKALFEAHDGEVIYPSEIADTLDLDYDLVLRLIGELEKNGDVAGV